MEASRSAVSLPTWPNRLVPHAHVSYDVERQFRPLSTLIGIRPINRFTTLGLQGLHPFPVRLTSHRVFQTARTCVGGLPEI